MKTWLFVFLISLSAACVMGQPAEHPAEGAVEHHEEEGDPRLVWKWANFAILAAVIGYGAMKGLPGFLKGRNEEITKGITEATAFKAQAVAKARNIEARMAQVGVEIEALRPKAMEEMRAEGDRIKTETEKFVSKIHEGAMAEIEAATKQSKAELKSLSAKLAIDIAVQKMQSSAASAGGFVDRFISDLAKDAVTKKGANS